MRQKFTGYEADSETGLNFAQARYQSSAQGRFTSPDPLGGSTRNPQSFNRYTYVRNNPLNLTDPSGLISSDNNPFDASIGGAQMRSRIGQTGAFTDEAEAWVRDQIAADEAPAYAGDGIVDTNPAETAADDSNFTKATSRRRTS